MTRGELLQRMTSAEITEWMAYYRYAPFGDDLTLVGSSIVAATVANVNRRKGTTAFKPKDFYPSFEGKEQTVEDQLAFAAMMTEALGGEDKRKK